MSPAATALPFGKYKGVSLTDVPADYLQFLLGKLDLYPATRKLIEEELTRRSEPVPPSVQAGDDATTGFEEFRANAVHSIVTFCPACGHAVNLSVELAQRIGP